MTARRLSGREIALLRYLARVNFVKLSERSREIARPLWRRGIIRSLLVQTPGVGTEGPYFQLTTFGHQLARAFMRSDAASSTKGSPSSMARVS
jgi:hypothetical protein